MNLEIIFHFPNRAISLIQVCLMEFKWSLATFFVYSVKRR